MNNPESQESLGTRTRTKTNKLAISKMRNIPIAFAYIYTNILECGLPHIPPSPHPPKKEQEKSNKHACNIHRCEITFSYHGIGKLFSYSH